MKKIFTIAALLFSVATFAAERPKPAKVSITSKSNSALIVKIDGKQYNLNRNSTTLENLKPGSHTVQIYKMDRRGLFGIQRSKVLYNSTMFVGASQLVDIDISRFDQVNISKSDIDRGGRYGNNDRNDRNDRDDHDGRGRGNDRPGRF